MPRVTFNFWAGARAAAGTATETVEADSVGEALDRVLTQHADDRFSRVIRASSLLTDGVSVSEPQLQTPLDGPVVVEVLPPFAGG